MSKKFVNGNVKEVKTKYGTIINIGITEEGMKTLQDNVNKGWANFSILTSEAGKQYMAINEYKQENNNQNDRGNDNEDDSVPF